jgi:chitin disaccharide deacetylase
MSLVINADDFGLSESVNNTILMLFKKGIVKSASIIAAGEKFEHAIEISKKNPLLDIGVHLCLSGPFNIGKDYHTILDPRTNLFFEKSEIIKKLKRLSVAKSEIFEEYSLQIEKVMDNNIRITHLDSHHHLHLYPPSLMSIVKCAKKFKIPYIRTQKILFRENTSLVNYAYKSLHQLYLRSQNRTVDGLYQPCIRNCNNYKKEYIRINRLFAIKNSDIEVILHPRDSSDPETSFFSSSTILDLLKSQRLMSYNDLIGFIMK